MTGVCEDLERLAASAAPPNANVIAFHLPPSHALSHNCHVKLPIAVAAWAKYMLPANKKKNE